MRASNNILLKAFGRIAGLVVAAFLWPGCLAGENSLAPEMASADDGSTAGRTPTSLETGANYPEWYVVQSRTIKAGSPSVLKAGRYKLIFDGDELLEDLTITVQEWDPDVIDVDFLPDGLVLVNPATLEIDYKGTANDPDSPDYNGVPHAMYFFDPSQGWVEFEGYDNTKTKKFTSQLHHFSRYAMFDGAGGVQAGPARYRSDKGFRDNPAETGK